MYRSRLQKMEEKRNIRIASLMALGTVGVILVLVVLGIPLLVRLAVFLGDLNSSGGPIDRNDLIPPAPPVISFSYDATNSATQELSGVAEPGSTVFITHNSESLGEIVVKEDGTFQYSPIRLNEGNNDFQGVAVDQAGNRSNPSSVAQVFYSNKEPKLDVTNPTDHQQVSGPTNSVEVKGSTDVNARLTVNDRVVVVGGDGNFSTRVNLNQGDNLLVIVATDRAGNQIKKEITVNYVQ